MTESLLIAMGVVVWLGCVLFGLAVVAANRMAERDEEARDDG